MFTQLLNTFTYFESNLTEYKIQTLHIIIISLPIYFCFNLKKIMRIYNQSSYTPNRNFSKGLFSPSVTKKEESIVLKSSSSSSENEENTENANVPNRRSTTGPSLQKGLSDRNVGGGEQQPDAGGACNLCYEPDSSGRLVEHYSTQKLQGMAIVGRWTAGDGKKIAGFKFKRNAGRNVLIGNCSAGVLGRRNYCNGVCQFVKSAKRMNGNVVMYDIPDGYKAMPVDVYLYYDDDNRTTDGRQTVKLVPGESYTTKGVLAVGVLPKGGTTFYERETVDLLKWLFDAESRGYSSKC